MSEINRTVVWFSCGAASALSAKIALKESDVPVEIVYCDTASEHEDNQRFLHDCEHWFGRRVTILKSKEYADIWDVFKKTRWLVGPKGARCTTELKKRLRWDFEQPGDLQVFGYTAEEEHRMDPEVADVYLDTLREKLK